MIMWQDYCNLGSRNRKNWRKSQLLRQYSKIIFNFGTNFENIQSQVTLFYLKQSGRIVFNSGPDQTSPSQSQLKWEITFLLLLQIYFSKRVSIMFHIWNFPKNIFILFTIKHSKMISLSKTVKVRSRQSSNQSILATENGKN